MKKVNLFSFLFLSLLFASCTTVGFLETAETLSPGDYQIKVGGAMYLPDEKMELDDLNCCNEMFPVPMFSGRLGLFERLDAGVTFNPAGLASVNLKYRLTPRDSSFQFALGPAFNTTFYIFEDGNRFIMPAMAFYSSSHEEHLDLILNGFVGAYNFSGSGENRNVYHSVVGITGGLIVYPFSRLEKKYGFGAQATVVLTKGSYREIYLGAGFVMNFN